MPDSSPNQWNSGVVYADLTDVGMRRANNQDSHACLVAKSLERYQQKGHLFVVADGMGAHAAGELASSMATEHMTDRYFRSNQAGVRDAVRDAVTEANDEIHRRGQSNPEFHNMGTTISALVLAPEGAVIGHVGDSRVYRLRDGKLEQLTFDHSLAWEMEASGKSGLNVPKNVITRSLGPSPSVEVDVEGPFPIHAGDKYLVCSDGLTGLVEDDELGPLMGCLPEDQLVKVLVDLANLRGGPDNITLIVAHAESLPSAGNRSRSSRPDGVGRLPSAMILAATICFAAVVCFGVAAAYVPMLIAAVLGVISSIAAAVQWSQQSAGTSDMTVHPTSQSPYRTYDAAPTKDLHDRLHGTIDELREAAGRHNWLMEWGAVDKLESASNQHLQSGELPDAIRLEAQAIVETMKQLREQNNRAANETAIDR